MSKQTTHDPAPRRKVYTVPRWSRDGEMHLRLTSLFGPDYAEKSTKVCLANQRDLRSNDPSTYSNGILKAPMNSEITDAGGRVGRSRDTETEAQGLS